MNADDLQIALCGRLDLDFAALRSSAVYEGFTPSSPQILWLWDCLLNMTEQEKRSFLNFVTGSERAPVRGLASLKFCVQKNGDDSDRLPTSLTCFSRLLLPEYATKARLENRWVETGGTKAVPGQMIMVSMSGLSHLV